MTVPLRAALYLRVSTARLKWRRARDMISRPIRTER